MQQKDKYTEGRNFVLYLHQKLRLSVTLLVQNSPSWVSNNLVPATDKTVSCAHVLSPVGKVLWGQVPCYCNVTISRHKN